MSDFRWITPAEAASILDISEETVRAWCRRKYDGEKSPITRMKQGPNGNWKVSRREIWRILRTTEY